MPDEKNEKFVVDPDDVEDLGYLGKDGQFHKELPPDQRAELPGYDSDDEAQPDSK